MRRGVRILANEKVFAVPKSSKQRPKQAGFWYNFGVQSLRTITENTQNAIAMEFKRMPSVPNWCRMCKFLAEHVFIAAQQKDATMCDTNAFRQALGYLRLPPKRLPSDIVASDEEWRKMNYYDENERLAMTEAIELLKMRLGEWAISLDGDEVDEEAFVPRKVWRFLSEKDAMCVFKAPQGKYVFRSKPFVRLCETMNVQPMAPELDVLYQPQKQEAKSISSYQHEILEATKDIRHSVSLLASDALSEGRARGRAGSSDEIEQEDEIQSRYRAAGRKGLREIVAQVLRDPRWARANGHPNTDKGRQRCYNRVYALEHPLRRAKK